MLVAVLFEAASLTFPFLVSRFDLRCLSQVYGCDTMVSMIKDYEIK
jgi:hypothetical protein